VRIGFGYDVHRLVEGRKLVIGGVEIPHAKGLAGHSDADVLLHAICDGLLGAMGEGDIGKHFPDTDPQFRGISSLKLLRRVTAILAERNLSVGNLDTMVIAEQPRIMPYIPSMRAQIAEAMQIAEEKVNIKATTSEGLGFVGEGEGIVAYAVVLLVP
jgi:2-C-methyl-D-erythritol 2,4-cyclodiphosphate synthase